MLVSEGNTEQVRWETSANIPITDCRRLGMYKWNTKRLVWVSFLYMKHKNCLLSRKSNLPQGVFVDNAFSESIKRTRSLLRPILKLAKTKEEYKGCCKIDKDQLIIKGKHYTLDTLNQLPDELAPYKTAQRSSTSCLVFQGLHSPLSNFHQSPFIYNGYTFNTAEHFIQYTKACHFNDYKTAEKIKTKHRPFRSKNFKQEHW